MFAVDTDTLFLSESGRILYCSYSGDYSSIPESIKKEREFEGVFNLPEPQISEKNEVFEGLLLEGGGLDLIELNSGYFFDLALVEKSDDSFRLLLFFEEFLNFEF